MSASGQPYRRWKEKDHPYLVRKRLRLEALLGSACSYCGLSRADGVNLQFHHPLGRDWTPSRLSWGQRLARYAREIAHDPPLLTLACDQTGNNCHEEQKKLVKQRNHEATRLYDYDAANQPF